MLDLLHKVDYTGEQRNVAHVSSTDSSSVLEVQEPETPETSMAKSHDQYSGSQRFGLRLAPPSQQSPTAPTNNFFSLQSPSQSVSTATLHANPCVQDEKLALFCYLGLSHEQYRGKCLFGYLCF